MEVPKYIEKIITRRAELAMDLNSADHKLSKWLEKNDIEVEECDISGGCELYVNPYDAAERIREAIRKT